MGPKARLSSVDTLHATAGQFSKYSELTVMQPHAEDDDTRLEPPD
jgi:hypothetical protein